MFNIFDLEIKKIYFVDVKFRGLNPSCPHFMTHGNSWLVKGIDFILFPFICIIHSFSSLPIGKHLIHSIQTHTLVCILIHVVWIFFKFKHRVELASFCYLLSPATQHCILKYYSCCTLPVLFIESNGFHSVH